MAKTYASVPSTGVGKPSNALPISGDERVGRLKVAEHKRDLALGISRPTSPTGSPGSQELLAPADDIRFLRLPEVKVITGLSKSSLYGLIRDQSFPSPVRLGPRAVAWVRSEVNQWAAERVIASRLGHEAVPKTPGSVRAQLSAESRRLA